MKDHTATVLYHTPYDPYPLVETIKRIVEKCVSRGRYAGLFCSTPEAARWWMGLGARFISYVIDTGLFTAACRAAVKEIRGSG